jgi:hypothetical protein
VRVTSALTNAVYRAFNLSRSGFYSCQRVGRSHTQIVMTMHSDDRLVDVLNIVAQILDKIIISAGVV